MPPLDWSIVLSVLLWLIIPAFGTAAWLLGLVVWKCRSESIRSLVASIAFLAGLTVGLVLQNSRGELVPFIALQQVERSTDQTDEGEPSKAVMNWEFETGWRSLYSATMLAGVAEILIDSFCRQRSRFLLANILTCLVAMFSAMLLTPWNLMSSRPWVSVVLAIVILLNEASLRRVSQLRFGSSVPLFLTMSWGGSAIAVTVLSHSARFADLAMLLGSSLAGVGLVMALTRVKVTALFAGPACFVPALMLADQQNTYSSIPIAAFVLIAIAPVWFSSLFLVNARNWFESRPIVLAIGFLIPCAVAVGLSARAEL